LNRVDLNTPWIDIAQILKRNFTVSRLNTLLMCDLQCYIVYTSMDTNLSTNEKMKMRIFITFV
jgi:hypothetical protein